MELPGWGGSAEVRMQNGSEPEPWHCPPFVAGSCYGIELLYHYESECHVVNDGGNVQIEWDHRNEPGGVIAPDEFALFAPSPSKFYKFSTMIDLQSPPGYVLRTNPHPRFFTDEIGDVPLAIVGHVQSEWWSKRLFVVFKAPPPGSRHIFRKNEPYVQILFVPEHVTYNTSRMTPEQEERRAQLEKGIDIGKPYVAKHVWHNPSGAEFSNHYKVLSRQFKHHGMDGVEKAVERAVDHRHATLPTGKTLAEYFALAEQFEREGKLMEAKSIYLQIRGWEPRNAEGACRLGMLAASMGLTTGAIRQLSIAISLEPRAHRYRYQMGEVLRLQNKYPEAQAAFMSALELHPGDPEVQSALGLTLVQQGRTEEGLGICRAALQTGGRLPVAHLRMGHAHALAGSREQALRCFNAAIALDPQFAPALNARDVLHDENCGIPMAPTNRPA